ncbi:uncharacterized protein [Amphiura filiformis]|uniref:uncharacterized protein n=1 Tax=Amphiura filiformis TaxID=82378 RepID=UPI003B213A2E
MADNEGLSLSVEDEVSRSSPATSGMTFSDLNFHEKLGRGSFGIVYKVTFKKPFLNVKVGAAKSIAEEDLKEEALLMKILDHPNIVKLYGVLDGHMGTKILLLEYAPNGTVRDYLTQHEGSEISVKLLKKWARESALGLQYLHQKRLLHRDVKASNSLVFEDNVLKLSDFGLAREMTDSETTSTAKGTWRYMAPEIHKDDHFSFKTDIYAYGMLVLEIGTGKPPFDGMEPLQVVFRVGGENLKPTIPADFPKALGVLIWRCWNANPKYRPSLAEALEVIDGLADEPVTFQKQASDTASASVSSHSSNNWRLIREFGKEGEAEGEFLQNGGIGVCNNSDVVVTDFPNWEEDKHPPRRAYVFSHGGKFKYTLHPPDDKPEARMISPQDVAITSRSEIAIADTESQYVKIFNEKGTYLRMFSVLSDENQTTMVQPFSISVASNGDILVSCVTRKLITIHDADDGRLISTVKLNIKPHYMTTNNNQQIFVCDWAVKKVHAVNYAGDVIFSLESFTVDGKPGMPAGITCDEEYHIYIAVMHFNPADNDCPFANTGHIHQYSHWGRFIRCIITNMYSPRGVTWHNDTIYVANARCVSMYRRIQRAKSWSGF